LGGPRPSVEIIAAAHKISSSNKDPSITAADGGSFIVTGRVLKSGAPLDEALVWCAAYDSFGNAYSPRARRTNSEGEFTFDPIPVNADTKDAFKELRINAHAPGWRGGAPTVTVLSLERGS
jgi:hypothetical protein